MSQTITKYEEFLQRSEKEVMTRHGPFMDWFIKNIEEINKTAKYYQPPEDFKYMLTFTIDPKKVLNLNDPEIQDIIEKYIEKVLYKVSDDKCYYVKEHADTNVHWHCIIYRNSALKSRDFASFYKKKYGHVDISKSIASDEKSDVNSVNYLQKEGQIKYVKGTASSNTTTNIL